MDDAGVNHHTYDAKTGGQYRITRIGATLGRLEAYAEATQFVRSFEPRAVEKACKIAGLGLENPPGLGDHWYPPYSHLSAPYEGRKRNLYTLLTEGQRVKLLKRVCTGASDIKGPERGCGFDINSFNNEETQKEVLGFFALHNKPLMAALEKRWMPLDWPWKLPLDDIADYFGEELGMYFGFLGHISSWTLTFAPCALAAQALAIYGHLNPLNSVTGGGKHEALYVEAWFALIGGAVYALCIDSWRCEQAKLAHTWNTYGCTTKLPPRPGFNGVVLKNPTTGALEIDFPPHLRAPRARKSVLVSLTMLVVLLGCVVSLFAYKAILASDPDTPSWVLMVPSFLNAVQVTVFSTVYKKIAHILTNFENHKTVVEHNSALFTKLTLFYFVNNYATLFFSQ